MAKAARRFEGHTYRHWDIARLGTKANLPDLLAVLLEPQIAEIDLQLQIRERLCRRYEAALAGTPFRWPTIDAVSARHLFPIHVPGGARDAVLNALGEAKIGATVNYRCVPALSLYRTAQAQLRYPISWHWGEGTLSLPLYPSLREDEQDEVIAALRRSIATTGLSGAEPAPIAS